MVWEGRTGGKGHPAKIDAENILTGSFHNRKA